MRLPILFAVMILPLAAGNASAQTAPSVNPLPGVAAICANCHGTEGRKAGDIPPIAGLPAKIIVGKLNDYRADKVPGATVMPRLVKGLTDEDIQAVAAYFSRLQ